MQSIDSATFAATALEIFHSALVVHQYRHHLVGLWNDFVEGDIPCVVVNVVHNLKREKYKRKRNRRYV